MTPFFSCQHPFFLRGITAFFGGGALLLATSLAPAPMLAVLLALIVLIANLEWGRLSGLQGLPGHVYSILPAALLLAVLAVDVSLAMVFLAPCLLLWLWLSYRLLHPITRSVCYWRLSGLAIVFCAALMLAWISVQGRSWLLYLLGLVWLSDSIAYLVGRKWGKHRLAPQISPGKTAEGALAALAAALFYAAIGLFWLPDASLMLLPISVLTALATIIGDLYESQLKRQFNAKDSGQCLPGHGGMLDRMDGLFAAAPVFVLYLLLPL